MTKTNSWCLRIVTLAVRPSMTVFSSFANEESFSRDQCGADWLCFKFCSCFGVGQCQPQQGWVPSPPGWALQLPVALCSLTLEHNPLQQAWELIGVHPDNCLLFSGTYLKDSSLCERSQPWVTVSIWDHRIWSTKWAWGLILEVISVKVDVFFNQRE